ncbi:DUF5996 family protein [Salegentibacter salarius]|uniref:Uncharacterized protein n=1 Tax=Salegentibacter salarius TaxID=435906 RepID=A0A2N0TUP2_9FLAO|nr:DUF5996 family protein [Salegentibacter salarius]OEY72139.1 hypothetical protein BHS39_02520 [Salegentibacter salarius]PKD18460.1 hypothetical protein APR40_02520 [Salegentibacter salarius]SLJ87686.1 hypothetical protein SAMN05660445_00512 [Salegentibacter salarius]
MEKFSLPDLRYVGFEKEKLTLHLFLQVVGKIRMKLSPRKNHWWYITHYLNQHGFTTGAISYNNGFSSFSIDFNFIKHQLEIATSEGDFELVKLESGLSISDFYKEVFTILKSLKIEVNIVDKPFDLGIDKKFSDISEIHQYDKSCAEKLWKSLLWTDGVFKEFSGRFYGKTCPVHLYWHSMDLAVTRFSGKKAPKMPAEARLSDKDAYTHECISFGFWPGDDKVQEPAFYSYTFPNPEGLESQELQPKSASWEMNNGSPMAILTYANLREEENPRKALLDFMESAYQAGAELAGWPIEDLKVPDLDKL